MNCQEGSDDVLRRADVSGISIPNKVQSDRDPVTRLEGEDGVDGGGAGEVHRGGGDPRDVPGRGGLTEHLGFSARPAVHQDRDLQGKYY